VFDLLFAFVDEYVFNSIEKNVFAHFAKKLTFVYRLMAEN